MDKIQVISTVIIIAATIFNIYMTYWKYSQQDPVIDIKTTNLPPYENKEDKTVVNIKNVGQKKTKKNLIVVVSCSWMPGVSYKLNFHEQVHYLAPNEEISWKLRINDEMPVNSSIHVRVSENNGLYWDYNEQIT